MTSSFYHLFIKPFSFSVYTDHQQEVLTGTAQTLLEKPPDEFSTQVTPGEVCVVVGLEVVPCGPLPWVTDGHLNADSVSNQTDGVVVAGLDGGCGGRGGGCQLDGVINAEVLQLNELTVRHPACSPTRTEHGDICSFSCFGNDVLQFSPLFCVTALEGTANQMGNTLRSLNPTQEYKLKMHLNLF